MIVIDIETSGLHTGQCGIWQIGAIDLDNLENKFLEEARIDEEDTLDPGALKLCGKTPEELRSYEKQSQKMLLDNFIDWCSKCDEKIILGHNVGFDITFIQNKCLEKGLQDKFWKILGFKTIDLHTLSQEKYKEIHGKYLVKENSRSAMSLPKVLEFCGIKDHRLGMDGAGNIHQEGNPHNALEDCKLTSECYNRIVNGKGLFEEYKESEIPEYLKK